MQIVRGDIASAAGRGLDKEVAGVIGGLASLDWGVGPVSGIAISWHGLGHVEAVSVTSACQRDVDTGAINLADFGDNARNIDGRTLGRMAGRRIAQLGMFTQVSAR